MSLLRALFLSLDPEQIERAAGGDAAALEELLVQVLPQLRGRLQINDLWSRSFDVDDILQVTSLEAFLRVGTLEVRTPGGFVSWLQRIAENNLRDAVRGLERGKRPSAKHRLTRGGEGESSRTLLAAVAGEHATAGGKVALAEELRALEAAIEQLPPSYREVIREVDLAERPIREVAQSTGRSEGALYMLRSRARDRLREVLSAPR